MTFLRAMLMEYLAYLEEKDLTTDTATQESQTVASEEA